MAPSREGVEGSDTITEGSNFTGESGGVTTEIGPDRVTSSGAIQLSGPGVQGDPGLKGNVTLGDNSFFNIQGAKITFRGIKGIGIKASGKNVRNFNKGDNKFLDIQGDNPELPVDDDPQPVDTADDGRSHKLRIYIP